MLRRDTQSTPPLSLNEGSGILVRWVNGFRFDFNPKIVSKSIDVPALPGGLGASGKQSDQLLKSSQDALKALETTASVSTSGLEKAATPTAAENEWRRIKNKVDDEVSIVQNIRIDIDLAIQHASEEHRCYQLKLQYFSQPILTEHQRNELLKTSCTGVAGQPTSADISGAVGWPDSRIHSALMDLTTQQLALSDSNLDLVEANGYKGHFDTPGKPEFIKNEALKKLIVELLAELNAYRRGSGTDLYISQTRADYEKVVDANEQWRQRLQSIKEEPQATALEYTVNINPAHEWYGRGRTDTISLHVVDVSSSTLAATDIALGTNTCNPLSIASTGIGVSFLPSPTYGFIPDASGNQVIGKTAVNDISPLYSVLYNVKSPGFKRSDIEMFISPGVGLVSTSSTTNADFLAGLSLSFARRLIFLTGSADFGRRDELLPGFAEGAAKGSLTSVPTRSTWKTGAMISVTFGIAPAQ